mmetsp:Transcript_25672/g.53693  ORF Transcript_25672/g.53693 Transcript_25672/m.53693 type:complete len:118 (+) Transcript_25672:250-603(+)
MESRPLMLSVHHFTEHFAPVDPARSQGTEPRANVPLAPECPIRPSVPVIHVWNPIPPPVNAARAPTCTPPAVDAMAVTLSTLRFANVPVALDPILLTATVLCAVDCDGVPIDFGIGQ